MWNFDEKPLLVFWETTRACDLACQHCRASAIASALPGELDGPEGFDLLSQIAAFGRPSPILILPGGDVLKRHDLFEVIEKARSLGIPTSVSPSVTPLLNERVIDRFIDAGVAAMSLSLDDSLESEHDALRGVPGTWRRTLELGRHAVSRGLKLQINSTVRASNIRRLPALFEQVVRMGADIWEVFFLIRTGRGMGLDEPDALTCEAVCHFLYNTAFHGVTVRTVEAPFFRRLVAEYEEGIEKAPDALACELIADLEARLGKGTQGKRARSAQTRDGKGIVFIAHDGDVSPSGFLPLTAGNIRDRSLADIYRNSELFTSLRSATGFGGVCGQCRWRDLCGGSRARALAHTGDPLGVDNACVEASCLQAS